MTRKSRIGIAIRRSLITLAFLVLAGGIASAQGPVHLKFTYWGSPQEKAAIESMIKAFNASHPNIVVEPQQIPSSGYNEKMATMVASGQAPDVAYLNEDQALPWAAQGVLMDLTSYFKQDPAAAQRLPSTFYRYGNDQTIGTNTAVETMILYYNKKLFDQAGVAYPPSQADKAWTWDEFVKVAQKLTKDRNGNDATSPNFDPNHIETYGISFPTWWAGYLPFIYSNGGRFASEDGTKLLLNQPAAVEVLQKMQDLIYKYHVAPTPAQSQSMPSTDVMMQTGKVAMDMNGHWKVIDYSHLKGLDWSMGVLPKFKTPETILFGAPTVIFKSTKHPDAAFEFYKYHNDPALVDLYKKGLWMPLQLPYYTDPAKTASWLDGIPGVYPPEAQGVLVDYTLHHTSHQPPSYWLKNQTQIFSEAVNPAMDLLWTDKATAQQAMDQAVAKAAPLMKGRY